MSQKKTRFALYISSAALDEVSELYTSANCKTKSDFIEKAILFYASYLHTKRASEFLPDVLSNILSSSFTRLGDRMGHLLFKLAVECNIVHHLIAADNEVDRDTYEQLRNLSVREVKSTNGEISFLDDLIFQKSI